MSISTKAWDRDVITDLFNHRDQECIFETPIYNNGSEDKIVWKYESSGMYTVKSAYRLIQRTKGAFNTWERSKVLMQLWKTKTPPRVLNIVWRAVTGCFQP